MVKLELELPSEKEQTEQERKEYCSAIFAVFPRLEKDIKQKMYEELVNTYSTSIGLAKSKDEMLIEVTRGNGKMEGMAILLEMWRLANTEAQAKVDE